MAGIRTPDLTKKFGIDDFICNFNAGSDSETVRVPFVYGAAQIGAAIGAAANWKPYASKAALDADLAPAAGFIAFVYFDADPANNGMYEKAGASGTGSWTKLSNLVFGFNQTPGGSDGALQFNDGGLFGGSSGVALNAARDTLTINARIGGSFLGGNNSLGAGALAALTTGSGNLAIGFGALPLLNNSVSNTAIGVNAGDTLTGGPGGNVFVGAQAGNGIVDGAYNTILGPALGLPSNLTGAVLLATGDNSIRADYNYTLANKWTLLGGLNPASLPIATTSALGGVKVGSGLSISPDGNLQNDGSGVYPTNPPNGSNFSLQIKNGTQFGGAAGSLWNPTLQNLSLAALNGGGANASKSAGLAITGGAAAYDVGASIKVSGSAYSALDVEIDNTSGGPRDLLRFWTNIGGTRQSPAYFAAGGGFYTRVGWFVSGAFSPTTPVDGDAQRISHPSADPAMCSIWSDVNAGPCLQIRAAQPDMLGQNDYLSLLSGLSDYVGVWRSDGVIGFGAYTGWGGGATHANIDTWLGRGNAGPGTIQLGGMDAHAPAAQTLTAQSVTTPVTQTVVSSAGVGGDTITFDTVGGLSATAMPWLFESIVIGQTVTNQTTPGSLLAGTTVTAIDSIRGTITISQPIQAPGVTVAEKIVFQTADTAGADLTIAGSKGTGTGAGGSLRFKVAPAGSSGSAQNALADALVIDSTKAVKPTTRIDFPAGSVAAPSLTFGVASKGFYFPYDSVAAYTNGSGDILGFGNNGLLLTTNTFGVVWTAGGGVDGTADLALRRNAAGTLEIDNGSAGTFRDLILRNVVGQTGYHEMAEMTAPSAPAADKVRIYAEDNGAGKTRLMALFPSGAAQQIAIEP